MKPEVRSVWARLARKCGPLPIAGVAALQLVERLAVAGAAVILTTGGREAALAALVVVAALMAIHRIAAGAYRVRAQGVVLQTLTAALLGDREGIADALTPDGELALVEGMYAVERTLGQRLPEMAGDLVASAALGVLVLVSEPRVILLSGGAAIAAGAAVVLLVRNGAAARTERAWQAFLPALDDLFTVIHGRLELVGNGGDAALLDGLDRKLSRWRRAALASGGVSLAAGRLPVIAAAVVAGLVLWWRGGWGEASLSSAALLAGVTPPFAALARAALDARRDLVRGKPAMDALLAVTRAPHGEATQAVLLGEVAWSAVSFRYRGQSAPTLHGVDVVWRPRELLGLAGQNGSGKSTLLRLALGLHAPTSGDVTVSSVPLSILDGAAHRQRVSFLVQRPLLHDRASVREAVHMLSPEASDAALEAALRRVGLWPVLAHRAESSPLDVKVGSLSAGEKQRVALARVLLRDTPILILDEPDANLDAEGVALLARILREEVASRMVLFTAHSPELLEAADRVVELRAGRVVLTQSGAHPAQRGGVHGQPDAASSPEPLPGRANTSSAMARAGRKNTGRNS